MDEVAAFKQRAAMILAEMRSISQLSNLHIAQLNDLAFRSLRQGKQKKID